MTTEEKAKRVGRLFIFMRENGYVSAINLDAVTYASQHAPGTVYVRVDGGNMVDIPAEHGDAFAKAMATRAAEVG